MKTILGRAPSGIRSYAHLSSIQNDLEFGIAVGRPLRWRLAFIVAANKMTGIPTKAMAKNKAENNRDPFDKPGFFYCSLLAMHLILQLTIQGALDRSAQEILSDPMTALCNIAILITWMVHPYFRPLRIRTVLKRHR